ncbi:MAG: alpha-L-fucosidase [Phycisphaerales bacterium]|nr:alpha-L-fucosidase [Phycisphaerales bacterium]
MPIDAALALVAAMDVTPPAPCPPLPTPAQRAWQDIGFTGFIHFGPNTFTDREWGHGDEPAAVFDPTALDARQWVRVMKDAGIGGVVITAKHHDGFCNWPTALSRHSVRSSPWKEGNGDVLRELSDACREAGMRFGVYLSPWDRNNPAYGTGEAYNRYFRDQLREVLTSYGPVFEVWFDGACGEGPNGRRQQYDFPSFERTVRELQPNAVIFSDVGPDIRWVGNEQGWAGETCWSMLKVKGHGRGADNPPPTKSLTEGDEDGEAWIPAECDVSIRPGWFYHAHEDDKVKGPAQLFDLWERSVGHNANFHLNFPVDRRGLIHERDAAAARGLRALVDAAYGPGTDLARGRTTAVSQARGTHDGSKAVDGDPATSWATADGTREATIEVELDPSRAFDRVVLAEPIEHGQRVRRFRVSVPAGPGPSDNRRDWRTLAEGTTIGHRRIVRVPTTAAQCVRIEILDARACPLISHVGVHRTVPGAAGAWPPGPPPAP